MYGASKLFGTCLLILIYLSGSTLQEFLLGVARNQITFLQSSARDDQPFRCTPLEPVQSHIAAVKAVLDVLPHILPVKDAAYQHILTHPDLTQRNVIIADDVLDPTLGAFIDWQGSQILPGIFSHAPSSIFQAPHDSIHDFYQGIDDPFSLVNKPTDVTALGFTLHDKARLMARHRYQTIERVYLQLLFAQPDRTATLQEPSYGVFLGLPMAVLRSWEDGLPPLRRILFRIHDSWSSLAPPSTPVPDSLRLVVESRADTDVLDQAWNRDASLRASVARSAGVNTEGRIDGQQGDATSALAAFEAAEM